MTRAGSAAEPRCRPLVSARPAPEAWRLRALAPSCNQRSGLAQVLLQECNRLRPCLLRMRRMVRRTLIAHEPVVGICVQHDLGGLPLGFQRIAELVELS